LDSEASANSAREQNAVFQRRIEGEPLAAIYVADVNGTRLLGMTRQLVGIGWTGAAPFQYCGSISYSPRPFGEGLLLNSLHGLGNAFADAFQLRGLFGIDLILSGDELFVLEINPRYTASVEVVERATDTSANCHGKAILFAKRNVVVSSKFAAWALELAGDRLADVPAAGTTIAKGRPVVTLFAAGKNPQSTSAALQKWLAEVENRLD
jgi:predicted ATP-grasp superfamily ATP-dependent carboligase